MKVSLDDFFSFCRAHAPLLLVLAEHDGEISEAEVQRLIREMSESGGDPGRTAARLRDLQILVPVEPRGDDYMMSGPVRRLLLHLSDQARAATPQMIRGYIDSLVATNEHLTKVIDGDPTATLSNATRELDDTLLRIQTAVDETYTSIAAEVAAHKSERSRAPLRERLRRIVYLMTRYVEPMIDIVDSGGPLASAAAQARRLLGKARGMVQPDQIEQIDRRARHLLLVRDRAFHVFQQCRLELRPLCEELRRESAAAQGAAVALERMRGDDLRDWAACHMVPICDMQRRHAPTASAIDQAVRGVIGYVAPAPVVVPWASDNVDRDMRRHIQWICGLGGELRSALPVPDLLAWLIARYADRNTSDTLAGFAHILFDTSLRSRFTDGPPRSYVTADGTLRAVPVEVTAWT